MRLFDVESRGSTIRTEIVAGVTTFMTMSYILFVNPAILSAAGVPLAGAATATALGAAVFCILMGIVTDRPIAMASGMGLNAAVAFGVIGVGQSNHPWQVGMAVIFVEGVIILILVLTGLREKVMHAIPLNLKRAIGVGIGIFITLIGLAQGGIIRPAPVTMVTLGDLSHRGVLVTLIGLFATLVLRAVRMRGYILGGMAVAAAAGMMMGIVKMPQKMVALPDLSTIAAPFHFVGGRPAVLHIATVSLAAAVFSIMLTDFFDTMGTVVAVGEQAGFVDSSGRVPGLRGILTVDSLGAVGGGFMGASSVTSYIESAAGIAEGARTGLMPVVTGLLFLGAAFLAPMISIVGGGTVVPNADEYAELVKAGFHVPDAPPFVMYPVTAGALIIVGFMMMNGLRDIPWSDFEESFPAFLIMLGIPLTYSISNGIGLGFISHVIIKIVHRKWRDVHPLLYAVSIFFLMNFLISAASGNGG